MIKKTMETKKKRSYERMSVVPISIEAEQQFLAVSITGEIIVGEQVTVEWFENDPSGDFEVDFD